MSTAIQTSLTCCARFTRARMKNQSAHGGWRKSAPTTKNVLESFSETKCNQKSDKIKKREKIRKIRKHKKGFFLTYEIGGLDVWMPEKKLKLRGANHENAPEHQAR